MLKSLEIFGFKSFADRIRFDFSTGVTGVVGPNGSGKSNVVDAIKWILGDQSPKSLRGREMTDVIFNGASGRKPSNFAEATLTFDNSSGFLPIPAAEVQIGRRINRDGQAEYRMQGVPARLKDIRDLFLGTGAGSASYCIIEQGRVDQLLQANLAARRLVFEEAAGISRFKSRKVDSERKLERVEQHLARLTDIVEEVQAQLATIRSQAVKAAKYRQVSEQLRELWLGLAADQFRDCDSKRAAFEKSMEQGQVALDELNLRLKEIEEAAAGIDDHIAQVDDRLRETERERAAEREEAARQEAAVRHQTARIREVDSELGRLRHQRVSLARRVTDAERGLASAVEQRARYEQDLSRRREGLEAQSRESAQLTDLAEQVRQTLQSARQRLAENLRQISEATGRTSALQSRAEQHHTALAAAQERQIGLGEQTVRCRHECGLHRERVRAAADEVSRAADALDNRRRERLALAGVQEQFHKTLADRREQRSAWRARKSVLEDLESRQEGLGLGPKDILSRAQTASRPPWNEILGNVADLLEVDLEHAALVEIALGLRAQAIVMSTLGPLIEYMGQAPVPIAGRVGFVAGRRESVSEPARDNAGSIDDFLDRITNEDADLPDLSWHKGVQARADALVRSSPRVPGLGEQLLRDTWVVDKLETALELAAGVGRGCRFVTLQGELLESDGTLTVGTLRGEATIVSQKSELRRLKQDLARVDRQIREDEQRLEEILASLVDADRELESLAARLQEATDYHALCKGDFSDRERDLARLDAEQQLLAAELRERQAQLTGTQRELEQAQLQFAMLDGEIESLRQEMTGLESRLLAAEDRASAAERSRYQQQLELAKNEERLESLQQTCERLGQERRQLQEQFEESERRLEHVLVDRRRIALFILNTNARLAESSLEDERLARRAVDVLAERESLRSRRGELLRDDSGLRNERRGASDRLHELELHSRELRLQIESLSQRIEEEYPVRLAEVAASGASAVAIYARELSAQRTGNEKPDLPEDGSESASPDEPASNRAAPVREREADIRYEDVREELEARVNRLRRQLKLMGSVNTESLRDLDGLESRFAHLSDQLADLVEAKQALEEILRRINAESKRLFSESFQLIRGHFQDLFRRFFGGGEGDVVLEDSQDILECAIEIVARPPGKDLRSISLLSGGEKTLTAVALLLAIFKSRPSPFCILDEVDAALDEANIERFAAVLAEFKKTTQFLMVTHSKRSMAAADILYGVTMEESGVSKRLSVRFEDVDENGEIRVGGSSRSQGRDAA